MATIRTVSTHGKPTEADGPVIEVWPGSFGTPTGTIVFPGKPYEWQQGDRWVPVSELLDLPPTPLPPVVTITIPRDVAEDYAENVAADGMGYFNRARIVADLCREALEGDR